jgi:hypothetical protein
MTRVADCRWCQNGRNVASNICRFAQRDAHTLNGHIDAAKAIFGTTLALPICSRGGQPCFVAGAATGGFVSSGLLRPTPSHCWRAHLQDRLYLDAAVAVGPHEHTFANAIWFVHRFYIFGFRLLARLRRLHTVCTLVAMLEWPAQPVC